MTFYYPLTCRLLFAAKLKLQDSLKNFSENTECYFQLGCVLLKMQVLQFHDGYFSEIQELFEKVMKRESSHYFW